jgi:hypothetical protein
MDLVQGDHALFQGVHDSLGTVGEVQLGQDIAVKGTLGRMMNVPVAWPTKRPSAS